VEDIGAACQNTFFAEAHRLQCRVDRQHFITMPPRAALAGSFAAEAPRCSNSWVLVPSRFPTSNRCPASINWPAMLEPI
jgi:hypothetical protein